MSIRKMMVIKAKSGSVKFGVQEIGQVLKAYKKSGVKN